jgi:hypothetical protein
MTKLISILIILVVSFCGYHFYQYCVTVRDQEETKLREEAATFRPENLAGLPTELEPTLRAAMERGPATFSAWLKNYGARVQDPRKAWIELEYAKAIARENPAEARKVYAEVKGRISESSPVWPHVKALEKALQ